MLCLQYDDKHRRCFSALVLGSGLCPHRTDGIRHQKRSESPSTHTRAGINLSLTKSTSGSPVWTKLSPLSLYKRYNENEITKQIPGFSDL
jgi:hypothetical protein